MLVFGALFVGSYLLAVADGVPAFDAKQTCRGTEAAGIFPGRNLDSCVRSEQAALDQLRKRWPEFPPGDRAECVNLARISGPPSYVELITCLEMRQDARKIRANSPDTPERPARGARSADGSTSSQQQRRFSCHRR